MTFKLIAGLYRNESQFRAPLNPEAIHITGLQAYYLLRF